MKEADILESQIHDLTLQILTNLNAGKASESDVLAFDILCKRLYAILQSEAAKRQIDHIAFMEAQTMRQTVAMETIASTLAVLKNG